MYEIKAEKMGLTIDLYKKQNITTFLLFIFCLFLLFFCFCYKVEENCGVLVHKPQRLLLLFHKPCICLISVILIYSFTSISAISATTPPTANCEDDSQYKGQCPGWAKIGECQKNPAWMKLHCRKSCKICGKCLSNIIARL